MSTCGDVGSDVHALIKELAIRRVQHRSETYSNEIYSNNKKLVHPLHAIHAVQPIQGFTDYVTDLDDARINFSLFHKKSEDTGNRAHDVAFFIDSALQMNDIVSAD